MKVSEVFTRLNSGENVSDIAQEYGVHRKTVSNRIKRLGYTYDKNAREYIFEGDEPQEKDIYNLNFFEFTTEEIQNIFGKSSEKPKDKGQKKKNQKSEEKSEEVEEVALTQEEIKYFKKMYRFDQPQFVKIKLSTFLADLPPKKPEKKVPYIISESTFEEFKAFCTRLENEYRTSQNELVEAALLKFMKDFRDAQSK